MNDSECKGSRGFFGSFLFMEKLNQIYQYVTVEYSSFSDNFAIYGGILGFSENILNLEAFIYNNTFVNNAAESKN